MKPERASVRFTLLALAIACASALLAISLFLHAYGDLGRQSIWPVGPGTYSTSALGYAGLYDLLASQDRPLARGRGPTLSAVGSDGTLIVAEPNLRLLAAGGDSSLSSARRLLLVLPKWDGTADAERPAWLRRAWPLPPSVPRKVFSLLDGAPSEIVRVSWPGEWFVNEFGAHPVGAGHVQLIRSRTLRPLVASGEGILLGELFSEAAEGRKVWVLSDPDVMSNHGIVKGENALFMLSLLDTLRLWQNEGSAEARIVFDEAVHGFHEQERSPVSLLLRFPLVVVTFLLCCAFSLLVWAGAGRFGPPAAPRQALDLGKSGLIESAVRLLDYSGHQAVVLKRHIAMTLRDVGESLHLAPTLSDAQLAAELDRIGRSQGRGGPCSSALETLREAGDDEKSLRALFLCAGEIYKWKGDLLHGLTVDRRDRRIDQG